VVNGDPLSSLSPCSRPILVLIFLPLRPPLPSRGSDPQCNSDLNPSSFDPNTFAPAPPLPQTRLRVPCTDRLLSFLFCSSNILERSSRCFLPLPPMIPIANFPFFSRGTFRSTYGPLFSSGLAQPLPHSCNSCETFPLPSVYCWWSEVPNEFCLPQTSRPPIFERLPRRNFRVFVFLLPSTLAFGRLSLLPYILGGL